MNRKVAVRLLLVILAFAMLMLSACSGNADANRSQAPQIEETETPPPTLPPVQVEMPEYELAYSGELSDVIVVTEQEGTSDLEFAVKLSNSQARIFTLHFNADEGELVTFVTDKAGNRVPVAFDMATVPEKLSEADANTFYMAQDAVNEIVASLVLK